MLYSSHPSIAATHTDLSDDVFLVPEHAEHSPSSSYSSQSVIALTQAVLDVVNILEFVQLLHFPSSWYSPQFAIFV